MGNAANRYFQLAFDDFVNLFLRVEMLMDRRARVELVMCECHAWRVEIAASPAWQTFDSGQFVGIDEWHVSNPQRCVRILRQAEGDRLAARTREAAARSATHYWDTPVSHPFLF